MYYRFFEHDPLPATYYTEGEIRRQIEQFMVGFSTNVVGVSFERAADGYRMGHRVEYPDTRPVLTAEQCFNEVIRRSMSEGWLTKIEGDKPLTPPKPKTKLQQAAVEAMADLLGEYEKGGLPTAAKQSTVTLYDALVEEGVDVSDYAKQITSVREDVDE